MLETAIVIILFLTYTVLISALSFYCGYEDRRHREFLNRYSREADHIRENKWLKSK